jgi:protein-tyrosine kinase
VNTHLVSLLAPSSFEAEQYRVLRHTVEQRRKEAGLGVLAVTSATVGDGKTTTAINLAGALAQAGEVRVLLVDVDLRRGSLSDHLGLGLAPGPGLAEAIRTPGLSLAEVTRRCPSFNMAIVPAGACSATPYEALKSQRLAELIAEGRQSHDYVVLDTPPLVRVADCRVIEKWVDGFLMVVAAHKTPRKLVQEALDVIDPAKLLGIVFNRDDRRFARYYGYSNGGGPFLSGQPGPWWRRLAGQFRPRRSGRSPEPAGAPRTRSSEGSE